MYLISKEFHFSASHQLDYLPESHQCARLHGHNYIVVVELASESLNDDGFVRDYTELSLFKDYSLSKFVRKYQSTYFWNCSIT